MKILMFTGLETFNQGVDWHVQMGKSIAAKGADTWLLKVADGTNIAGWLTPAQVREVAVRTGLTLLPWTFSYGYDLPGEKTLCRQFQSAGFDVVIDAEDQYFTGSLSWKDTPVFGVTSYANPLDHGNLMNNLNNFQATYFLPQVYTSYDELVWQSQYAGYACIPVVKPETMAAARGFSTAALWEDQVWTTSQVATLKSYLKLSSDEVKYMEQQFMDMWHQHTTVDTTGICSVVKQQYMSGVVIGAPLGPEYTTVDWSGVKIQRQDFSGGWVEWYNDGKNHGYTLDIGKIVTLW